MTTQPEAGDRGAGAIGTSFGVLVYLLVLLAAVQILFGLYATTTISAAGHDAAAEVASIDAVADRCAATARAEQRFLAALGDYGERGHASLVWDCADPDVVSLRVIARHPTILPPRLAGLLSLDRLDRTFEVRAEAPR